MAKYQFTIDRNTWLRGDADDSFLLRKDGMMCCLGQIGAHCGVPKEYLFQIGDPASWDDDTVSRHPALALLVKTNPAKKSAYPHLCSDLAGRAIDLNDAYNLTENKREENLIKLFAYHDIKLTFIN